MPRKEVAQLVERLHKAQQETIERIIATAKYEDLGNPTPDGFTVQDVMRMWVWHFWSHHRDLVRARGNIEGDNPHFHIPHFIRQANEEFGRFVGELACMTDDQLDLDVPDSERTVREVVDHVLAVLDGYVPEEIETASSGNTASEKDDTTEG